MFSLTRILSLNVRIHAGGVQLKSKKKKKYIYIYIYKWRNQRGRIDSLLLWVSRLSARQTELSEQPTYIYRALLPQHWALYAKVDSAPKYIYIYIYIYIFALKFNKLNIENRRAREKNLGARTRKNNKLNPRVTPGIKPRPQQFAWRRALSLLYHPCFLTMDKLSFG